MVLFSSYYLFFYFEDCIWMYISYIKNENTGFFISLLTMATCCCQKSCFRDNFSQKKFQVFIYKTRPEFFWNFDFFHSHCTFICFFYRGCWRTSMPCFTAAHSRGKQWWLQIWSSCCKFLTMIGPWIHVFYLNPFKPQYPHTNSPDWPPHISFKN